MMADLVYQPRKPGIKIFVHTADIVNVIKQPDVLNSMTEGELQEVTETLMGELNYRSNQKTGEI